MSALEPGMEVQVAIEFENGQGTRGCPRSIVKEMSE
jgi:hypothetical protein